MKRIFILAVLIVGVGCNAQSYPVLRTIPIADTYNDTFDRISGDYIKDTQNHLNQYVGTWQYNQNGVVFTLKLVKVPKVISIQPNGNYYFRDELVSTYKLVKNGITLIDNLPLTSYTEETSPNNLKYGTFYNLETFDYLKGIITDLTNNVIVSRCEITRLPGTPAKIFFKLYSNHSWKRNPPEFYQGLTSMYSLPNEVELVKID